MRNRISGDHVAIDIRDQTNRVLKSIQGKVNTLPPSPFGVSSCIHRVQEKLRKVNEDAYTPEKVSIGPFHRGKEHLKPMENLKLRYAGDILAPKNPSREIKKEALVESIQKLEQKCRKCYSEPINLSSDEFVEMMLIDGLFILQLFRKYRNRKLIESDDPIFNTVWGLKGPMRDLILLENQIPMFVLDSLFQQITIPSEYEEPSLSEIALYFFNPLMPYAKEIPREEAIKIKSKHLLDFLAKTLHPSSPINNKSNTFSPLHCVTNLQGAGMKFKKETNINSTFLEVKYESGVLKIPQIVIQDQTETLLRNLIAFEQSCGESTTYITSYAFLMDSLINSGNDVRILRKGEVISHYMGDDEDVSKLFNNLCNEVTLPSYYYSDICDKMKGYYNEPWHYWRATLTRHHFRTPWTIISLVAAILLLVLTFLQTLYTMKDKNDVSHDM